MKFRSFIAVLAIVLFILPISLWSQEDMKFKFIPDSLTLNVGDTAEVEITVVNEQGEVQEISFLVFARGRRSVQVTPRSSDESGRLTAKVIAHKPGSFALVARTVAPRDERVQGRMNIEIPYPPLEKITFVNPRTKLYANTTVAYKTKVFDEAKLEREKVDVTITSSNPEVASFDGFLNLTAHKKGKVSLIAKIENIEEKLNIQVIPNPVTHLELKSDKNEARTGDVFHFEAIASDKNGNTVEDAPVHYSVIAKPLDNLAPAATGQVAQDGRFVAETPGLYTILAKSGNHVSQLTVSISPRNIKQKIEVVGHGPVTEVFTSDLWVWEGVDGKDYAVTGTWGSNGEAYFWDVTDPSNMTIIDTITVDARTVNDVKVSEDGRICVISREGASDRKNGLVILDVSNPHDVKILSEYSDELTGGVHNIFVYKEHIYAVNNGRRYDVISIKDPKNPRRVSRFELNTPGHSIHDVWIEDGIAYSSNWGDGLQLVDVGSGTGGTFQKYVETPMPEIKSPFYAGGSPENPVQFASYAYPSGRNHAAFPFHSKSTNKFYVLAGDESFPYGLNIRQKKPTKAAGWIHFVDFTDPGNPDEVARYEVPEAGSHNLWIEDDILYAAFYNGGLRVVDISGELMGDLYRQGREIAWYLPMHSEGLIPNAPMVWGPQPYKGNIFFSDLHSGLWCVRLVPRSNSGTN